MSVDIYSVVAPLVGNVSLGEPDVAGIIILCGVTILAVQFVQTVLNFILHIINAYE